MATNPVELAAKIIPLNFTQGDLDYFVEFLTPLCKKIDEIEGRNGGKQLAELEEYFKVSPNCPQLVFGPIK